MKIRFLLPLVVTLCFTTQLLAMPKNSNPLSDSRVRQAIAYAIDMDTIQETLLEGKAIVAVIVLLFVEVTSVRFPFDSVPIPVFAKGFIVQ